MVHILLASLKGKLANYTVAPSTPANQRQFERSAAKIRIKKEQGPLLNPDDLFEDDNAYHLLGDFDTSLLSDNQHLTSPPLDLYVAPSAAGTILRTQEYAQDLNLNYHPLSAIEVDRNYPIDVVHNDATLFSHQRHRQNIHASSLYPHDLFAGFDMNIPDTSLEASNSPSETGEANLQKALRCRFPNCSKNGELLTESALLKHEVKHKKLYVCPVAGCKHPRFGDKGGLDRHAREVHGNTAHCCPIHTCKRHTRGFPRKYNLFEHQKRCHPGQSPASMASLVRTSHTRIVKSRGDIDMSQEEDDDVSTLGTMYTGEVTGSRNFQLHEKLRGLLALRVELDKDIEALKRAVNILDES